MRPSWKTLVFTKVGHSTVTATPAPASSAASVSDSDITPALETLYGAIDGAAANPAAEATLMIPPRPASRRMGVKTSHPYTTPHRLIPSAQSQSSNPMAPTGLPPTPTPALLITRVGGPPKMSLACLASCSIALRSDTSQTTAWPLPVG